MIILYFCLGCIALSLFSYIIFICTCGIFQSNFSYIKSLKKVSKKKINKVLISASDKSQILQKINNNFPRLEQDFDIKKARFLFNKLGLNFAQPCYVIKVSESSNFGMILEELAFLKKLDSQGICLNIILLCRCEQKRVYDLKYSLASLDFGSCPCRLFCLNDLSCDDIDMLESLNINYSCGTNFNDNILKNDNYRIFSKEKVGYDSVLNSTMQTQDFSLVQKWVLCNYCIESKTTYDFVKETKITRFDFSKAKGKDKICKFIPFEKLKYFHISIDGYSVKIVDFERGETKYFYSNRPIFNSAVYNKKGLYFSYTIDNSFVYIFEGKNIDTSSSLLALESSFIKAQTALASLPRFKAVSANPAIDEMVNFTLPRQMLKLLLNSPFKEAKYFNKYANLSGHDIESEEDSFSCVLPLVKKYFSLLKIYYGLDFGQKGLYLSYNKNRLLNSNISFKKGGKSYSLKILNNGYAADTFKLKGIEHSGTNYLPYEKLYQSLVLQM